MKEETACVGQEIDAQGATCTARAVTRPCTRQHTECACVQAANDGMISPVTNSGQWREGSRTRLMKRETKQKINQVSGLFSQHTEKENKRPFPQSTVVDRAALHTKVCETTVQLFIQHNY